MTRSLLLPFAVLGKMAGMFYPTPPPAKKEDQKGSQMHRTYVEKCNVILQSERPPDSLNLLKLICGIYNLHIRNEQNTNDSLKIKP